MIKNFGSLYLTELRSQAKSSSRQRQHRNIHESYQDPCQRLFNAIEPGSYIRPHRHISDPRDELLIAIRGEMALVVFDEQGDVALVSRFGTERYGQDTSVGVEVTAHLWHTVIALQPGSVLLEVKAGPFDPSRPKDLAPWAPAEGSDEAQEYLNQLIRVVWMRTSASEQ